MTVVITAIFPTLTDARGAADCLAVRPGQGQAVQISVEHCDHTSVTAASRMLHPAELLDSTPTCSAGCARGSSAILRIRCTERMSGFVTRELAALGAEKVSITTMS